MNYATKKCNNKFLNKVMQANNINKLITTVYKIANYFKNKKLHSNICL